MKIVLLGVESEFDLKIYLAFSILFCETTLYHKLNCFANLIKIV